MNVLRTCLCRTCAEAPATKATRASDEHCFIFHCLRLSWRDVGELLGNSKYGDQRTVCQDSGDAARVVRASSKNSEICHLFIHADADAHAAPHELRWGREHGNAPQVQGL